MSAPTGEGPRHLTWTIPYSERAHLPGTSTLANYLYTLIASKETNLCLSADVTSTRDLLRIAEEVGDSICLLKTHCDHIEDFSDRTSRALTEIARRKRFLIFEDRKFLDIGSTAYKQYTKGPFHIAQWAHITNATIFSGPAIVSTLREAALETITKHNSSVKTEITVGSPTEPGNVFTEEEQLLRPPSLQRADSDSNYVGISAGSDGHLSSGFPPRKESVVSITTTVSMKRESISPVPPSPAFPPTGSIQIPDPPFQRSLLLLAQMSSADNYFSPEYTASCVRIARQHGEFVMGFIAQQSLNSQDGDNFITMTPGVQLPPPGQEGKKVEGTQGQQYNSPRSVIFEKGSDVVIVGRGILNAADRRAEAERYRREAWKAYKERIGQR